MPFKSKAQQRWMYAAEARGEVPKGTASEWESETHGKLPERVMKKEGMFFRDTKGREDGMFMKNAQINVGNVNSTGGQGSSQKVTPTQNPGKPIPAPKLVGPPNSTGGGQGPTKMSLPSGFKTASLAGTIGHPGIGRPGTKTAADSRLDAVENTASRFSGKVQKGFKQGYNYVSQKDPLGSSLKYIDSLSPATAAVIAGGAGLYGVHKVKKGLSGMAARRAEKQLLERAAKSGESGILKRIARRIMMRGK